MPDDTLEVLIRLRGGREFVVQAQAADRAVAGLGSTTRTAGVHADASRSTFARLSNTFWTFRNMAYIAGSALTGFGLGAIAVQGLNFNATMEQNTTSFRHFLGSTRAATKYLNDLYKLAATTPFEFQPLATAAKQMLAFGFTSRGALDTLRSIGDAVSGLGTGTEGIDRIVLAFGQMKSAGVVQGDELRQLQEAGINANKYLIQAGMIKRSDIGKIGLLHLDSTKAIAAIVAGMNKEFGGLSAQQAKTFTGQLSTARDYAKQFLGVITQPAFDWLRTKVLPGLTSEMGHLQAAFKIGGFRGMIIELDMVTGAGGHLISAVDDLGAIFGHLAGIIRQLPLRDLAVLITGTLLGALHLLAGTLGLIDHHFHTIDAILGPLIAGFVAFRAVLIATRAIAFVAMVYELIAGFIALAGTVGVAGAAMIVLDIALGPITLIALAIGALIAVVVLVATHFKLVRIAAVDAFGWALRAAHGAWRGIQSGAAALVGFIRSHWRLLLAIMLGPFGVLVGFVASHFHQITAFVAAMPHRIARAAHGMWDGIKNAFRSALNWIIRAWNSLHFRIPGFHAGPVHFGGENLGVPHVPLLARGGNITAAGAAIIGDQGPELVEMPAGARVTPLDAQRESDTGPLRPIQLLLDGRVIAEVTARQLQLAAARA
jgi:tape measure domain-containing protein